MFIEALQCILPLPSHILQPFAYGYHFIGRNATLVGTYGIVVKNTMRINGDYQRVHASMKSSHIDMFKKAKTWDVRESQSMFHGIFLADILKVRVDQHSMKEFIIPEYHHPHRERS